MKTSCGNVACYLEKERCDLCLCLCAFLWKPMLFPLERVPGAPFRLGIDSWMLCDTGHIGITAPPVNKRTPTLFGWFSENNKRTPKFSESENLKKISAPLRNSAREAREKIGFLGCYTGGNQPFWHFFGEIFEKISAPLFWTDFWEKISAPLNFQNLRISENNPHPLKGGAVIPICPVVYVHTSYCIHVSYCSHP